MCNCSKQVTKSECQLLKKFVDDPLKRTFIYHIFDGVRGLEIAHVPENINPNKVAELRGFLTKEGIPEWYYVKEHPCLYENENQT